MIHARRIAALPRVSREYYAGCVEHYDLGAEAWEVQRCALAALAIYGGCVMQAGCGDGKGLVSMLGARMVDAKRPLVLIPGKLRSTFHKEFAKFRALGFNLPTNLEIKAHDFVSRHPHWLTEYAPDYIFIDEAHAFRRTGSARTRRLLRYLAANPTRPNGGDVTFAVASGTLGSASLLDFAHLFAHALGPRSPLPPTNNGLPSLELASWAQCLDVKGKPGLQDWISIRPLVKAFGGATVFDMSTAKHKREIAREAYNQRRRSTPGLIVSDSESVKASLVVYTHDTPAPPPIVANALAMVKAGVRPDGQDVFANDAAAWQSGQHVSIGVYYRWAWERTAAGIPDEQWLSARKAWGSACRRELRERPGPGYDSPGQVMQAVYDDAEACYRHGAPASLERMHKPTLEWMALRGRHDPDKLRQHVWLSDWYVRHIVRLALAEPAPVVIWYESRAMESALRAAGIPVYGAASEAPTTAHTCALAMRRHGEGVTHLQELFSTCYFAEFPASGEKAEQVLARLHRAGQIADEVTAHVFTHTEPFTRNLASAMEKAQFLTKTQGRQRLSFVPIVAQ